MSKKYELTTNMKCGMALDKKGLQKSHQKNLKFFMTFFCSSGFKKGHNFFEKGHNWPTGHGLVTPGVPCTLYLYFVYILIVKNKVKGDGEAEHSNTA